MDEAMTATFTRAWHVTARPTSFFTENRKERGMKTAVKYMLTLGAIFAVLSTAANFLVAREAFKQYEAMLPVVLLVQAALGYAFLAALFFLEAGLVYGTARLFGGKAGYQDTYRVIVYGDTPSMLAGWLPVIGIAIYAYSTALHIIGIGIMHRLPAGRAAIAVLIPAIIMLASTWAIASRIM